MFSALFAHKPPLDEETTQWLFQVFDWALDAFGGTYFRDHTVLVLPDDRHFPGRAESAEGMAALILGHVQRHAGLGHWPTRLDISPPLAFATPPRLTLQGPLRLADGQAGEGPKLPIACNPQLVGNPQACIAHLAMQLAHYMGPLARRPPPGSAESWPQVCELLAIYLGFGIEVCNSAHETKVGGCGSCQGPSASREGYLSQYPLTYALALFAQLKGLPAGRVNAPLKPALRPFFKQAYKDVGRRGEWLDALRARLSAPVPQLPGVE